MQLRQYLEEGYTQREIAKELGDRPGVNRSQSRVRARCEHPLYVVKRL